MNATETAMKADRTFTVLRIHRSSRWHRRLAAFVLTILLGVVAAVADDATGNTDRLLSLRAERDELLRTANRSAAAGDSRVGDANFAKVRELNAMITALRKERIQGDLVARQAALTETIGDLATYQTWFHDPFLLIAPAHDAEFAKLYRYLPMAEQAIYAQLGCRNRPHTATVIVAGSDRAGLRDLWRRLSGQDNLPSPEIPFPWNDGIIADMNHGPAQLLSGITRAFVAADFPDAPPWYAAMLATLNETSQIAIDPKNGRSQVRYPFNWRFTSLTENEGNGAAIKAILTGADNSVPLDALTLARLRHWALWLNLRGWLRPWHESFRDYRQFDPTGIAQLEKTAGKPLATLLAEYDQWLERQQAEWRQQSTP
jgi:hypothetical protein